MQLGRKYNYALPMIDVDDFKAINDTYGHTMGDVILSNLTTILKKNIRCANIVARGAATSLL